VREALRVRCCRLRPGGFVLILAALLLGACATGGPEVAAGSVPTAVDAQESGAAEPGRGAVAATVDREDPYAIPDEIDIAYLERVLEPIEEVYAEAVREIAREKAYTDRADELFAAIYAPDMMRNVRAYWSQLTEGDALNLRDHREIGPAEYLISEMRVTEGRCILFRATFDDSEQFVDGAAAGFIFLLVPRDNAWAGNSTPWSFGGELLDDGRELTEEC
jgi:hypothetical protein